MVKVNIASSLDDKNDAIFQICQVAVWQTDKELPYSTNITRYKNIFKEIPQEAEPIWQREFCLTVVRTASQNRNFYNQGYKVITAWNLKIAKDYPRKRLKYDRLFFSPKQEYVDIETYINLIEKDISQVSTKIAVNTIIENSVNTYDKAVKYKIANCAEKTISVALKLYYYPKEGIEKYKLPPLPHHKILFWRVVFAEKYDHVFIIVNPRPCADVKNPLTWGEAVIVDPWVNEIYKVVDALNGNFKSSWWDKIAAALSKLEIMEKNYVGGAGINAVTKNNDQLIFEKFWRFNLSNQTDVINVPEELPSLFNDLYKKLKKSHNFSILDVDLIHRDVVYNAAQHYYHFAIRLLAALIYRQLQKNKQDCKRLRWVKTYNQKIIVLSDITYVESYIPNWNDIKSIFQASVGATLVKMIKYNEIDEFEIELEKILRYQPNFIAQNLVKNKSLLEYAVAYHNRKAVHFILNHRNNKSFVSKSTFLSMLVDENYTDYLTYFLTLEYFNLSVSTKVEALIAAIEKNYQPNIDAMLDSLKLDIKIYNKIPSYLNLKLLLVILKTPGLGLTSEKFSLIINAALDFVSLKNPMSAHLLIETAIKQGGLEKLRLILDFFRGHKFVKPNWQKLLYWAVASADNELVDYILFHNAYLDNKIYEGSGFLHVACSTGNYKMVAHILSNLNININMRNLEQETALHIVIKNDYPQLVNLLVNCGANLLARNAAQRTAIEEALLENKANCVTILLSYDVNVQFVRDNIAQFLLQAVKVSYVRLVEILLQKYSAHLFGEVELLNACLTISIQNDCYAIADLLLKHGANSNEFIDFKQHPLLIAIKQYNINLVKLLLANDVTQHIKKAISYIDEIENDVLSRHKKRKYLGDNQLNSEDAHLALEEIKGYLGCYNEIINLTRQTIDLSSLPKIIFKMLKMRFCFDADEKEIVDALHKIDLSINKIYKPSYRDIIQLIEIQHQKINNYCHSYYRTTQAFIELMQFAAKICPQKSKQRFHPDLMRRKFIFFSKKPNHQPVGAQKNKFFNMKVKQSNDNSENFPRNTAQRVYQA
ncbi:MAG: hypothetical protein Tsb005_19080 [Gammaproteobacteria bacterium]